MASFGNDFVEKTVFQVVYTKLPLFFITLVVILLIKMQIVDKKPDPAATLKTTGSVIVEMYWDRDNTADVDLWVKAPGDQPVGYSNLGAQYFNLLRDDLGFASDVTGENHELAMTRGIPTGEYVVNVHLYSVHAEKGKPNLPVNGGVIVSCAAARGDLSRVVIFEKKFKLMHENEEQTLVRFRLDNEFCRYSPYNFSFMPMKIRHGSKPSS